MRRLARRDSGVRDRRINKGTADGPSAETDMINASKDMLNRHEAKTTETMDRFGHTINKNTIMVQNVKEEVLLSIATERMERQEQLMDMAKYYDRRFQHIFERLERLAEA